MLAYPVVTAMHPTHKASYMNLTGIKFEEIPEDIRALHSHELHVDKDSSPAFIWHTATDVCVPPIGSLRLAEAYIDAGVRVELHLYPEGPHGMALCTEMTSLGKSEYMSEEASAWLEASLEFIKSV